MGSWARGLLIGAVCLAAWPCCGDVARASGASLVRDIQAQRVPQSSDPHAFHRLGRWTVFLASTPEQGEALWRTDGTAAGTTLVKDLQPGLRGGGVPCLVERGGAVYFLAQVAIVEDFSNELALWRSDGTPNGTVQLARVPGYLGYEAPCPIVAAGERVIFAANYRDDDGYVVDLWRTNGTAAGTDRIAHLTSPFAWEPHLFGVGRTVYFDLVSPDGVALWRTDGTSGGTRVVRDFVRGGDTPVYPVLLAGLGDQLLFALVESGGSTLWRSNGSPAGTVPVVEIDPAAAPNYGTPRIVADGRLLFALPGAGIVVTDGTSAGTRLAADGMLVLALARLGDSILFLTGGSGALWRWDDLDAPPVSLGDVGLFAQELAVAGDQLLFAVLAGNEQRLWRSDGTPSGTVPIATFGLGTIAGLVGAGDRAFFTGPGDDEPWELWASDGTTAGTHLLADIAADDVVTDSSSPEELVVAGDRLLFTARGGGGYGRQVWASDGTAAGTALVRQIGDPSDVPQIGDLTPFAGQVYFAVGRPYHFTPSGLWRSDGTYEGTEIAQSQFGGPPYRLTVAGDGLYFQLGTDGLVCRTDGTDAGTTCGKGFNRVYDMVANGDRVVLSADPYMAGVEPWISDGTRDGTYVIKEIEPARGRGSDPRLLVTLGDFTYFVVSDTLGATLWRTDGTEAGTQPVRTWAPGTAVRQVLASGSQLFLVVDATDTASELWVSDGTADATRLVRRFDGDPDVSAGIGFVATFAGRLLMSAYDGVRGAELWISDGSEAGTRLVRDLRPGADSSSPQSFADLGDRCAFVACTDLGCEPWVTDGTAAGTTMIADVAEGVASSYPTGFAELHGTLYFAATDGVRGYELWREGEAPACHGDCRGDGGVTIDDLIQAVAVALGARPIGDCAAVDTSGDGRVTIDELIAAVGVALAGC